ncbi:hypothetical protein Strop_2051 [Salinispora tropica CNB-440]|uniref:Uncharacterized protein n=1 Tax=Salinispora tropica (strain ATCC BAA-916 / DSM 44818 / JCM 13857 / NBRC 105044 / CNB-440) TaxID=369723 RepID=A4X6K4_SALTO|nr:hypothetical protein Strop_2051 [Salinispora tropica CNB-440]
MTSTSPELLPSPHGCTRRGLSTDTAVRPGTAGWAATAAITAVYAPATGEPRPLVVGARDAADVMQLAVDSAGPHAIKFVDAAFDAYAGTGDTALLAASAGATERIGPW